MKNIWNHHLDIIGAHEGSKTSGSPSVSKAKTSFAVAFEKKQNEVVSGASFYAQIRGTPKRSIMEKVS